MTTPRPLSTSLPAPRPTVRTTAAALFALGACLALAPLAPHANAQPPGGATLEVDAQTGGGDFRLFYDKLTDGDWLQTNEYGYVFQPTAATQDRDWRPYTDGYWAQTDQGWTWVSSEPFGWACYHYGRWANLVDTGWVWVPGSEWAPAYVSWRVSKDKKTVGWAPLPPEARITKTAGVERWSDSAYDVGPESYTFIETSRIGDDTYRGHLLPAERVTTVFTESENVTSVTYRTVSSRSVIYSGGPDVAVIREVSGRPVRTLRLEYQEQPVEFFGRGNGRSFNRVNGDRFVVSAAAPEVIRSTAIQVRQPRNVARRLDAIEVNRGYRGLHDPAEADRIRAAVRTQAPAPPDIERQTATLRERGPGNRRGNDAAAPNAGAPTPATAAATPAAGTAAPPVPEPGRTAATPPPAPASDARRPAAGQIPPPAAPSAEPTRKARQGGAEAKPKDTPAAPEKPAEPTPAPRRETATPPETAATPRPSATREERPERRREGGGGNNGGERSREKTTPAPERETPRPEATPARKVEGSGGRGETPSTRRAGESDGAAAAPRREAPPAPPRGGDAAAKPEAPARRPEAERPERGAGGPGGPRGGGEPRGGGGAEPGRGEKKAGAEPAGEGKPKSSPQP